MSIKNSSLSDRHSPLPTPGRLSRKTFTRKKLLRNADDSE